MKNYGEILKEHRIIRGLTLKDIERETGINNGNLSRWERGEVLPNIDFCVQLANFYGMTVDELLGVSEERTKAENKNLIKRPPYEVTDKQTLDIIKLCKVMNEIQKAQVFGYIVALLEQAGVNVQATLRG